MHCRFSCKRIARRNLRNGCTRERSRNGELKQTALDAVGSRKRAASTYVCFVSGRAEFALHERPGVHLSGGWRRTAEQVFVVTCAVDTGKRLQLASAQQQLCQVAEGRGRAIAKRTQSCLVLIFERISDEFTSATRPKCLGKRKGGYSTAVRRTRSTIDTRVWASSEARSEHHFSPAWCVSHVDFHFAVIHHGKPAQGFRVDLLSQRHRSDGVACRRSNKRRRCRERLLCVDTAPSRLSREICKFIARRLGRAHPPSLRRSECVR